MAQIWIYCNTRLPFPRFATWKMKWLMYIAKKQEKKYKGFIFEWYVRGKNYKEGLELLYHRAYQGKVNGVMLYSLNEVGNEEEQLDFMERMQELNIPVFCLKTGHYLNLEEH